MRLSRTVQSILSHYESDTPGSKANLARILMTGKLAGTGKMVILPVDQGFEHGPARSFAVNPDAYDPNYHLQLAIDAGLNAYTTTLGMMEAVADRAAGRIPLILKLNSSNSWAPEKDSTIHGGIDDALRLGCGAIGFTVYPGSPFFNEMAEEFRELAAEAKALGLAVILWSYPRGGALSKEGETALDVGAYAAHLAASLGAHIIKVKLPSDHLEQPEAAKVYQTTGIDRSSQAARVRHIMQAAYNGTRLVVFSGGNKKGADSLYDDARAIRDGGGHGSIIGRNSFQRPRDEALAMLSQIVDIYKGKA
ncbi:MULTISPECIES: class I fructose-bisphosphate aldolase [unclassified Iodidimonas]|jgi:class I fructose-bisphosphate aldolase|uniref:class I fructose-bisphosphate aldolase n=1 Tax=unclassified Iodidimonas TaxID=2626145 RepID=UPI0024827945|nr:MULTISPECIES: class I fructose-bisphosphate aldolase [unclassified Iodidimonas]